MRIHLFCIHKTGIRIVNWFPEGRILVPRRAKFQFPEGRILVPGGANPENELSTARNHDAARESQDSAVYVGSQNDEAGSQKDEKQLAWRHGKSSTRPTSKS